MNTTFPLSNPTASIEILLGLNFKELAKAEVWISNY
jgi:hypothetical protein